ncbi:MAG: hypothetical protein KDA80_20395 [Planctomycetaceae bacterium]|nr:hypothetical protein [Planctomycetaceae bacterium]
MTTEEFVFCIGQAKTVGWLANHQEQVTILGLKVQDLNIGVVPRLYFIKFATAIGSDVNDYRTRSLSPTVGCQRADFDSCAQLCEFLNEKVGVHGEMDTDSDGWFGIN